MPQAASVTFLVLLIAGGFFVFFSFLLAMLSIIGGWHRLAKKYATKAKPEGKRFYMVSGRVGIVSYGNCLNVVVGESGLYLSMFPIFRAFHSPLLIPWHDLHGFREWPSWLPKWSIFQPFHSVAFDVGLPVLAKMKLPHEVLEKGLKTLGLDMGNC